MKTMITTHDLAERWNMNPKTLDQWRSKRIGPKWVRIGGKKILYRMKDILAYESENENEISTERARDNSEALSRGDSITL